MASASSFLACRTAWCHNPLAAAQRNPAPLSALLFLVLLSQLVTTVAAFQFNLPNPFSNPTLGQNSTMTIQKYALPKLPYAYDALEPSISGQIMELHHSKHHQTYITNLNAALDKYVTATSTGDIPTQIQLQAALRFNGGGHINHSLFWENLAPPNSTDSKFAAAPQLGAQIKQAWGSEQAFREKFAAALLGIQGSGWGWLVKVEGATKEPRLVIQTTKDQDPVVGVGEVPIFGVDMWEHAYYLQYLNGKAAYVENIWNVINWKVAEERYLGTSGDAFKVLKASM